MPRANSTQLVSAIEKAAQRSAGSATLMSSSAKNPRTFALQLPDGSSRTLWAYVWTLTPGGRPNLTTEYRIQLTGVAAPLPLNPSGFTAILGYDSTSDGLAGFDVDRHLTFTKGSPSIQIDITKVRVNAMVNGLGFDRKANGEIAVGIRLDHFLTYIANGPALHQNGNHPATLGLLAKAANGQTVSPIDLAPLSPARQRVISEVQRLVRASDFRRKVLVSCNRS